MFAPVRIEESPAGVRITNLHGFIDTSFLTFTYSAEADGVPFESGALDVPPIGPGAAADVPIPVLATGPGERWLTVRAVLAADEPWAPAGHQVAAGQVYLGGRPVPPVASGRLPKELRSTLRLDVWRAPIDNDRFSALEAGWRAAGLDRLQHRMISESRTRIAPAGEDFGLVVDYVWIPVGDGLRLDVEVRPDGEWPVPLPRLGLDFRLPAQYSNVRWLGRGPGEAYPDSRRAALVGAYAATVDELQTPYVFPQENGHRIDIRWVEFTTGRRRAGHRGHRLRLHGPGAGPRRPWTRPGTPPTWCPVTTS